MSGYLQRLASQAARPQANVRPLVNPITGPVRAKNTFEPLEENLLQETVFEPEDQPAQISTRQGTAAEAHDEGLETRESGPIPPNRSLKSDAKLGFQPLLKESEIELATARNDPAAFQPPERTERASEAHLEKVARDKAQSRPALENARHPKNMPRNLVGPQPAKAGHVPAPDAKIPAARSPFRVDQPARLQASKASSREVDEIQINIGRIEVTAVQQAAPRPSTPVRKAISLDEYLSRRNGRNG